MDTTWTKVQRFLRGPKPLLCARVTRSLDTLSAPQHSTPTVVVPVNMENCLPFVHTCICCCRHTSSMTMCALSVLAYMLRLLFCVHAGMSAASSQTLTMLLLTRRGSWRSVWTSCALSLMQSD